MLKIQNSDTAARLRRIFNSFRVFAVAAFALAAICSFSFGGEFNSFVRAAETAQNAGGGTGFIEICNEASGAGLENRIFQFQITNLRLGTTSELIKVPVGGCSPSIEVPAGSVTIQEVRSGYFIDQSGNQAGAFSGGFQLVDVSLLHYDRSQPNPLKNTNLYGFQATLEVSEGSIQNLTAIKFTNAYAAEAWIEICNNAVGAASTSANAAGYAFNGFSPNHQLMANPGTCHMLKVYLPKTPDSTTPVTGTARITQFYKPGFTLESVTINPSERFNNLTIGTGITDHTNPECLFAPDPKIIAGCTFNNANVGYADVDVVEGISPATATKVTFNNRVEPARLLKVCAIAGTGVAVNTLFTFDFYINDEPEIGAQPVTIPAGDASNGGNCIIAQGQSAPFLNGFSSFPANSRVTVVQRAANGFTPSAIQLSEGRISSLNLPQRKATVAIVDGMSELTFTNITTAPISTPTTTGTNVNVAPTTNVNLNFGSVSTAGETTVSVVPTEQQQPLPSSFALSSGALVYQITTSAVFSGNVTVSLNVPNVGSAAACSQLRILRYINNVWDSSNNGTPQYNAQTQTCTVSQTVENLSSFADSQFFAPTAANVFAVALILAPTAANVTIGGRAITESGRGIRNVVITMTDSTGAARTATTTSFGYYRFDDVAPGETYILTAKGRRVAFNQPSRVLNVGEDMHDADFIGNMR